MEKCLLHQALRLGDPLIKLLELRFVSSSSETSRSSGTIQTSQSSISSHPAFPDEEATTGEEGTQDKEATAPDMLPASSEPALELTIHSHFALSSWQAMQAVWQQLLPPCFIQGIPGGLPLANWQTDCKWTDLSCYTLHIPTFHKK